MKSIKNAVVFLSIVTLALAPMPISSQTQDYPSEFSPLRTSRPRPQQPSLVPPTKFVEVQDAIPNRYIVVLNDDVVSSDAPLEIRRTQITAIATSHAQDHLGRVGSIYETALKGYSIELYDEDAARAISENPQVKWVEQVGWLQLMDIQTNPPWGLDRIDQTDPVGTVAPNGTTSGIYIFNATGAGVTAYVLDSGIKTDAPGFRGSRLNCG